MIKRLLITIFFLAPAVYAQAPGKNERLWNDASVYRDEWGVPHVYANNPRAMAFVFGYAQAEDHLEDMLRAYRVANGRASEIYGEAFIESDTLALRMRHADLANQAYKSLDKITQHLCEGFASGVNSWIIEHPNRTPEWAEGVSPTDILALLHHYLTTMAPLDYDNVYTPAKGTPLANAWALDASRTKEGNPILVMNPHTDYDGIFQWYEAHLVTRDMNMYGATIFGLPVLLMGHNERLGWALAPNEPDTADIYGVLDSRIPYTNETDTHPLHVWEGNGMTRHQVSRDMTWYGPVIAYDDGYPVVYKVGGYRDFGGIRQLYDMGRARNLNAFQQAWDKQQLPLFHLIYADKSNNIFYNYNAKVGDKSHLKEDRRSLSRLTQTRWESPLTTTSNNVLWGNLLSITDELPWVLNPDSGFIQASGTPPWLVTEGLDWTEDDFDDWLIRDPDSYRAKRLRQVFDTGLRSFSDNQAILYDIVVPIAVETVPQLLKAAQTNRSYVNEVHPNLIPIIKMLESWDYQAHPDSPAMTFFHVWWTLYSQEYTNWVDSPEALHAMILKADAQTQKYMLTTAAHAARMLQDAYGTTKVPWGAVHVIQRGDTTAAIGGSYTGDPIFGTGDKHFRQGKWYAKQGPAFTMAVEFGKRPRATSALPFGTSQNPNSKHYDDQLPLMQQRRMKHTRFQRAEVESHAMTATGKAVAFRRDQSGVTLLLRAAQPVTVSLGLATKLNVKLPKEFAAFSPFIEPVAKPTRVLTENTLEIHIPKSLCSQRSLEKLAVYAYTASNSWSRVADQELDRSTRTFYAWGYDREVYAVLGPQDALIGEIAPDTYTNFKPDLAKLATAPSSNYLGAQSNELDELERQRIALAAPETSEIPLTPKSLDKLSKQNKAFGKSRVIRNDKTEFDRYKHNGALVPSVPPGWKDYLKNQDALPDRQRSDRQEPRLPPKQTMLKNKRSNVEMDEEKPEPQLPAPAAFNLLNSLEEGRDIVTESPQGTAKPIEINVSSESLEPSKPSPASTTPEMPDESPKDLDELAKIRTNASRRDKAEANNPFRNQKGKLVVQPGLPAAANTPQEKPDLALAPDPKIATRLILDKSIYFSFPKFGADFDLAMERTVRAQMAFRPTPAEAYPNGLVPFSPIFDVFFSPRDAQGTIAITMSVFPEYCAKENFDKLTLYAYDPDAGWTPMDKAKKSTEGMDFITLDTNIRNYVILGPKSVQLKPPQMVP